MSDRRDPLLEQDAEIEKATSVLRRGLADSAEIRQGLGYTVAFALVSALGSLLIPVLIQQIIDRGLTGVQGFRPGFVYTACAIAVVATLVVYVAHRTAFSRMVVASERAIKNLRVRVFRHIHRLSMAQHTETRRGTFVSRVTSDADTLMYFFDWAALSWITGSVLFLGTVTVMFVYSWRLALVVVLFIAPVVLVMRVLQRGLLTSYDAVRTANAHTLAEISESVTGAAVIRAYGYENVIDQRLRDAVEGQYSAQIRANRYMAITFPVAELFGALAMIGVLIAGVTWGPGWGLTAGQLVAFMFLVNMFLTPLGEITETFDMTQTAIAAWRKLLGVLDMSIDVVEPSPGTSLPPGALRVRTTDLRFRYVDSDGDVLKGIDLEIEPGAHIAIVGETGCGKTTFARLVCRLADPTAGAIEVGGLDLREVATPSRHTAIRMVPQDGFLFSTTIAENVRYGRDGAGDDDVEAAFAALDLGGWVARLPNGIRTHVGERGNNLSVGERQLVALARAQIADPGLLILDEATSSVDPETEAALNVALERLAAGRTTLTIAHRLSTAEKADEVLVFDAGRLIERGRHQELVRAGGTYAALHKSWLGSTGRAAA